MVNPAILTWPHVAGVPALGATFAHHAQDSTARFGYTFPGVPIGTPSPTRTVIVAATIRGSDEALFTNPTIGGIPATIDYMAVNATSGISQTAWLRATVPTGATATIDYPLNFRPLRSGIAVWVVDGPVTFMGGEQTTTNDAVLNPTIGNVVLGKTVSVASGTTVTWAGPTQEYLASMGSTRLSAATGAAGALPASVTWNTWNAQYGLTSAVTYNT